MKKITVLLFLFILSISSFSEDIEMGASKLNEYLPKLKGKKVGLVVNQTSKVGDTHTIDLLIENGVKITTLFSPEHGIRGKALAGEKVDNSVDKKTGLPIVSLYGNHRKPTSEDLKNVDILIFDIQDVGVRYYTYISTMHYVMEAAAENNKGVIIFDRPNPLGNIIDGPVMEDKWKSFIGMHSIPMVHGLTVGELALMINGEGWLKGGQKLNDLTIVTMNDWSHSKPYSLPIKPSPNLPNDLSIKLYPSLGLFEATNLSIGRGTDKPFQIIASDTSKAGEPLGQVASHGWPLPNKKIYGQDLSNLKPYEVNHLNIEYFTNWYKKMRKLGYSNRQIINRPNWLAKLIGTDEFYNQVIAGKSSRDIKASWNKDLDEYKKLRKKYLLYK